LEFLAEASANNTVEDLQAQIRAAVKAAVGFDVERKDLVEVNFIPFVEAELVESTTGSVFATGSNWMRYLLSALGLVLFFLYIVKPVMSQLVPIKEEAEVKTEDEIEEDHSGSDLVTRLRKLVDNYESVDAGDLNRLIERESEAAAQVIRLWTRHG
jgi:flagellar biosynthesis/type III secretory pathway M-ring protein FliF/YscJ